MIVTVTPNPALDLTYRLSTLTPGETHRVPAAAVRAGGKGLNVARVLHQQGHPVLAVSPAGAASGEEFAAELRASGLQHRLVPVLAPTRRSVALVDEGQGRTTILNEYGENHTPAEWLALADATAAALPGATCLVCSGSLPPGADVDFLPNLVALASARGLPSVIDTSGPALLASARAGATALKPNRQELAEATGEPDPVRGARMLLEHGAGMVLVSLGEEGMLLMTAAEPGRLWRARLPRVLPGNPTGAGDAAVAAIAFCLATGLTDPAQIIRRATAWSAAAVLMPLAGEISPDHAALADEIQVDELPADFQIAELPAGDIPIEGPR
ncbi:1-phosphofructokinase family hexose kinase [Cryobacterium sp. Sr8]|uniref:1-phosphofructokinase family hexose kinase n=1 Tax=Cryobacterium sp. Sr8 TaxID=1259203 RepID=UPI0010694F20|nr:1-phosphofructokinase family hexose kinase [Cryobacterium sp. Sr8]TFD81032.1 1-phosphofructokinase family hexose kinase [Cryobacterium sp. Sr8]